MPHVVRALCPAEGPLYRELRLEALRESPEAFASSYEEERTREASHFAERCAQTGPGRVFGAFAPAGGEERLLGMAGIYWAPRPKLRHKAHVWGVFVRPSARGRGCGRELLAALTAYARTLEHVRQLHLGVSSGNAAALRLYRACGFEVYGTEPRALIVGGRALDERLMVRFLDGGEP